MNFSHFFYRSAEHFIHSYIFLASLCQDCNLKTNIDNSHKSFVYNMVCERVCVCVYALWYVVVCPWSICYGFLSLWNITLSIHCAAYQCYATLMNLSHICISRHKVYVWLYSDSIDERTSQSNINSKPTCFDVNAFLPIYTFAIFTHSQWVQKWRRHILCIGANVEGANIISWRCFSSPIVSAQINFLVTLRLYWSTVLSLCYGELNVRGKTAYIRIRSSGTIHSLQLLSLVHNSPLTTT